MSPLDFLLASRLYPIGSKPGREKTMNEPTARNAAHLFVQCLENEGVKYVFGIPGEENIHVVDALQRSSIRFVLVRHEQNASFMADIYGRLTGQAGVCLATLGPGAINLLLGTADAQTDSTPLVAMSAQVGLNRIYKESHQSVDLVSLFKPVTRWAELVPSAAAIPEMVRSAFKQAQTERLGATYLAPPEDVEKQQVAADLQSLAVGIEGNMGCGKDSFLQQPFLSDTSTTLAEVENAGF